jgi:transposase-like protein
VLRASEESDPEVSSTNEQVPDPEVPAKARSRRYSASYKAKILAEYEELDKAGKGALLRREGLYTSLIAAWRTQRDQGALAKPAGRPAADLKDRENESVLPAGLSALQAPVNATTPAWTGESARCARLRSLLACQRRAQLESPGIAHSA